MNARNLCIFSSDGDFGKHTVLGDDSFRSSYEPKQFRREPSRIFLCTPRFEIQNPLHRCYTRVLISFSSRECQHADEIFGNDRHGSLATIDALDQLRKEPELEWSYLSPSAELKPGNEPVSFAWETTSFW
jgi:hypothetical protein